MLYANPSQCLWSRFSMLKLIARSEICMFPRQENDYASSSEYEWSNIIAYTI